jgi:hypothetical protein
MLVVIVGGVSQFRFSASSVVVRDVFPIAFIALIIATMIVQNYSKGASAGFPDALKGMGCFIGAFVCGFLAVKALPDTRFGATIVVTAIIGPILGGTYYISKLFGVGLRAMMTAFMVPQTMLVGASPASAPDNELAANQSPDHVEIEIDNRAIFVRFAIWFGLLLAYWLFIGRGYILAELLIPVGLLGGVIQFSRFLIARGPAMVLDTTGISTRRGIGLIRHLAWTEITTLELKSIMAGTYLVVGIRDADAFIARQSGFTRWNLRQSQNMFGSPVRIPTFLLKCDRNWLVQTAGELSLKYRNV